MKLKQAIDAIERAEKAKVRIVVDPETWSGPLSDFPLDEEFSPVRCELVGEARRLAGTLNRPKTAPEGCVYRHSVEAITAAVVKAAKHIETQMKGKTDDKSDAGAGAPSQPTPFPSDDAPDEPAVEDTGRARGAGTGKESG